jgi:ATP-dependent helicase HrpA
VEAFRWLLEEFRVSLFAQELGTAEPVSTVRLERALAVLRGAREGTAGGEVPRPAPPPKKPVGTGSGGAKKAFRLKSLAALGQTLPR